MHANFGDSRSCDRDLGTLKPRNNGILGSKIDQFVIPTQFIMSRQSVSPATKN